MSKESKAYKDSPKRVYIRTFGCQMNARDSEFVMGILLEKDYKKANSVEKADIVLFNSCSVRKHAEDRLFSNIAVLKKLKAKKPDLLIGLMGCTAQKYGDKALKKAPLVDFVCGPGNETDMPKILANVIKDRCPVIATDKVDKPRRELFPKYRQSSFKAYVSISEGCSNFCSYCIVPYVRGKERSRDPKDITREVKSLASRGFKEVTLLGQNVNSYRGAAHGVQGAEFVKLLEALNKIDGIERIRFMTSHPKDASAELFKAMRDLDKVCEHLHLPVQSGSDRVLKLMNRGYTAGKYLDLAETYKKIIPSGSITTDLVVGFPTETEDDFQKTFELMKEMEFDNAYMYKYSSRPPAKSASLEDDVSEEIKGDRLTKLLNLQCGICLKKNEALVGKSAKVLVDTRAEKNPSFLIGRTRTNKTTNFKADAKYVGKLVNVKIESASPHALKGKII